MKASKQTQENLVRSFIRKEIKRILEADEQPTSDVEAPEEKEAPEKEEPKKTDVKPVETEPETNSKLEEYTESFVKRLSYSGEDIGNDELVDIVSKVISSFASSSENKLNILKSVKSNIVR